MLSQTEHNQRLILNPDWKGTTQDLLDVESEALRRQQEAERRAARTRTATRRCAAQGPRTTSAGDRPVASSTGRVTRGPRSRGRAGGVTRGGPSSTRGASSSYLADNSTSSVPSARSGSNIGRGIGSTRGGESRKRLQITSIHHETMLHYAISSSRLLEEVAHLFHALHIDLLEVAPRLGSRPPSSASPPPLFAASSPSTRRRLRPRTASARSRTPT